MDMRDKFVQYTDYQIQSNQIFGIFSNTIIGKKSMNKPQCTWTQTKRKIYANCDRELTAFITKIHAISFKSVTDMT